MWGTPPIKDMGPVELLWDGDEVTPCPAPDEQTDTCENSTFPFQMHRLTSPFRNLRLQAVTIQSWIFFR